VDDRAIRDVLASPADPADTVRQLVVLAEGAGGPDNVTVVVIDVRAAEAGLAPAEPVILGAVPAAAAAR
jgi:serine/threonine protein phosphatase PrpC